MKVLGIDPGTGRLGWAVVQKEKGVLSPVAFGCIQTPANSKLEDRLLTIFEILDQIIKDHKPDSVSIEDIFFFKNQKTIISVASARGVVLLVCRQHKLPIHNYTPLQIKNTLTGYGTADKKQVEFMVRQTIKLKDDKHLDDTTDALATALTHLLRLPAQNLQSAI